MKKILLFLSLISTFFVCYAQERDTTAYNLYLKTLEKYSEENYSNFKSMSDSEFSALVKITYEGIESAPSKVLEHIQSNMHARATQLDIYRLMQEKNSYLLYAFVAVPVFIKAKVISITEKNVGGFRQMNLMLKPEYIIKGKEPALQNENLEVFHRYYEFIPDSLDYKVGKSYLFPIWDRGEQPDSILAIATWFDKHGSRFLIENGLIHDPFNIFSEAKINSWDNFLQFIEDLITNIQNERPLDYIKNPIKTTRN